MASFPERARTRAQRVASRIEYNGFPRRLRKLLFDDNGPQKLALLIGAAVLVTIIGGSWNPPMKFKLHSRPDRNVCCNTSFSAVDEDRLRVEIFLARKETPRYYRNQPSTLDGYRRLLRFNFREERQNILGITNLKQPNDRDKLESFQKYLPKRQTSETQSQAQALDVLQNYFENDPDLKVFDAALDLVVAYFKENGATDFKENEATDSVADRPRRKRNIRDLQENEATDSIANLPSKVKIYKPTPKVETERKKILEMFGCGKRFSGFSKSMDRSLNATTKPTTDVLFGEDLLRRVLDDEKAKEIFSSYDGMLIELFLERILNAPIRTLSFDDESTTFAQNEAAEKAREKVEESPNFIHSGESIVKAGCEIDDNKYNQLKGEFKSYLESRPWESKFLRFSATLVLNALLLIGAHLIVIAKQPMFDVKVDGKPVAKTAIFLGFFVFFFLVGRATQVALQNEGTLVELTPVVVFVELTTFAISWNVSLMIGVLLSLMLTVSNGGGLEVFVPLCGTASFVAFLARSVRTRLQLVFLAIDTGFFAFILSMASGLLANDFARPSYEIPWTDFAHTSWIAFNHAFWATMGCMLTTCLLPIVELYCHVVTPMRLLEYANPSHQLMIELNQRAPSTYNHSLQTSYLAEAAAEAIGARSYLVKVGAYFHDVGKMMNPEYFTENQNGRNIHDELEPRMSALVIVAHVKDGVNLGEKHKLPREIIDLIEQHHGTMLVSFFYQQALKAAQAQDPDARLDESPFRYPGPIPQSKEAGILMLADAVESASRSLTEWTPRRVENLVRKIAELRIEDGQFRDSGLTFGEIQAIQQSLVSSLLASRHTRVKYPDADKDSKDEKNGEKRDESKGEKIEDDRKVKSDGSKGSSSEGSQIIKSEKIRHDGSSISDESTILKTFH